MAVLIPTRNNPVGLAGLLSSIISQVAPGDRGQLPIFISDASDTPVVQAPGVRRLLPFFRLHYQHTVAPDVNAQRLTALEEIESDGYKAVLSVDDDLILLQGHLPAARRLARRISGRAVFGRTVDVSNERGYPDYVTMSRVPSAHAFDPATEPAADVQVCEELAQFSATIGHCLADPQWMCSIYRHVVCALPEARPEVIDDTVALMMAKALPLLSTDMQAWHVGNDNRWWKPWEAKRQTVHTHAQNLMASMGLHRQDAALAQLTGDDHAY
jgi:hypothetical protein